MKKEKYFTKEIIFSVAEKIKDAAFVRPKREQSGFVPEQSVLLVTDMQDYFLDPASHAYVPAAGAIIPNIMKLTGLFEKNNFPVVFTRHVNNPYNAALMGSWYPELLSEDTGLANIISELKPADHRVMGKSQYDAFYETGLLDFVNKKGKTQIVICGVMTNLCIETTARSAFVQGIQPFVPIDATACYTYDMHLGSIRNLAQGFTHPLLTQEILEKCKA